MSLWRSIDRLDARGVDDDDDITHAIAHRLVIDDLGEEPDGW